MKPFFIVISGTSGSGKTTLSQKLIKLLGGSTIFLSYDDYFAASEFNLIHWYKNGADPDEILNIQLSENLNALRIGQNIKHVVTGVEVQPSEYILLDEPFGRARYKKDNFIDLSIHLEVPMEISLARRMLRQLKQEQLSDNQVKAVTDYLNGYLHHNLSDFYMTINSIALANCDVVLNGMKTADELALEVMSLISYRNGGA